MSSLHDDYLDYRCVERILTVDGGCATLYIVYIAIFVADYERPLELTGLLIVYSKVGLKRLF
jgi:hypothetical protein